MSSFHAHIITSLNKGACREVAAWHSRIYMNLYQNLCSMAIISGYCNYIRFIAVFCKLFAVNCKQNCINTVSLLTKTFFILYNTAVNPAFFIIIIITAESYSILTALFVTVCNFYAGLCTFRIFKGVQIKITDSPVLTGCCKFCTINPEQISFFSTWLHIFINRIAVCSFTPVIKAKMLRPGHSKEAAIANFISLVNKLFVETDTLANLVCINISNHGIVLCKPMVLSAVKLH